MKNYQWSFTSTILVLRRFINNPVWQSETVVILKQKAYLIMDDTKIVIDPPLYMASTTITCWRCGADTPAVALIAPNVPEEDGEVGILSNIIELPSSVLVFVQARFPTFKRQLSRTTQSEYYANTCPQCGALSGDFYLHSEPGGAFFPKTEADAARLTVEEIPLDGPIEVAACLGIGCGDFILEHGNLIH
jgi:hypothetical protein